MREQHVGAVGVAQYFELLPARHEGVPLGRRGVIGRRARGRASAGVPRSSFGEGCQCQEISSRPSPSLSR
ncbi:MAG TPA: hypothetical protein VE733_23935 [Streptosporangiaceae bacterium]|nr:hypothetical protein [Streptosporangiaceae bacterium]